MTLFHLLILRPLLRDPLRTALTLIAVALGVAVVIGIELAGEAAAGSFQSSLATILGKTDLQVSANGPLDERLIARLTTLPIDARFSPAIEAQIRTTTHILFTLYGIDALGQIPENSLALSAPLARTLPSEIILDLPARPTFHATTIPNSPDSAFALLDIAAAQHILNRYGQLDRIDVFLGPRQNFDEAERQIRGALPEGVLLDRPGVRADENQRMLRAFRWNLRILSYISLIVGAFLIYNTISISVVRRRPEIGILRALGASRAAIAGIFLLEAALFGALGSFCGIAIGRLMAEGLVGLVAVTVNALYVSSRPAAIALTPQAAAWAALAGFAVALASAFAPAREAMRVAPTEAMARGSRETSFRTHTARNFSLAALFAAAAWWCALQDPVDGQPLFGYICVLFAIAAAAFLTPGLTVAAARLVKSLLRALFGAEGLLAARGLAASLGRTSVVIAALATAISMMASVGIMVGSFRETVVLWLDTQLRADLYIRASGPASAGVQPPIPREVPALVRAIPGVDAVDLFSALEVRYGGQRSSFGGGDSEIIRTRGRLRFLSGGRDAILRSLPHQDRAIVTQTFANKHRLHPGDAITLPLGERQARLTIAGIYYDYSSERGWIMVDRSTLLKYLPGQPVTSIAIYLKSGAHLEAIRRATAPYSVDLAANSTLRKGAIEIFDRTFAVTYALEGVAILVAMLGAANSLLALVLDRRREFGLLSYLGASAAQIRRMVLVEAGLLGALASGLGLALGFALSFVLVYVINVQSFGWTIQFHPPTLMLATALALVWCVTIVAGVYPARTAARLNPIDVIHEE